VNLSAAATAVSLQNNKDRKQNMIHKIKICVIKYNSGKQIFDRTGQKFMLHVGLYLFTPRSPTSSAIHILKVCENCAPP